MEVVDVMNVVRIIKTLIIEINMLHLCSKHEVNNPYIVIVSDERKCDWCKKIINNKKQQHDKTRIR